MGLHIEQIILHQLVRKNEQDIEIILRDEELETSLSVQTLICDINRIYNNKNKAYGVFNPDSLFADSVRELRKGNQDFLNFTQQSVKHLRNELIKYPFAEGGTVIFCRYRYLASEYLLIAILASCQSILVDDKLNISSTNYLDIDHTDIIARLDLTEWQLEINSKRYLTFLKGRLGRKVADFFMDYLGAVEGINAKEQTKNLVRAIDDYCYKIEPDQQRKQTYRDQAHHYCQRQLVASEDICLDSLSQTLPSAPNESFLNFVKTQPYELATQFPVHRNALKELKKLSGSGGGLTLNFDISLLGDRIFWDPETDTLTIKGTPPNLRDQLQRHLAGVVKD